MVWFEQSYVFRAVIGFRATMPGLGYQPAVWLIKLNVHAICLCRKYVLVTFAPLCDQPFNYPTLPSGLLSSLSSHFLLCLLLYSLACPIDLPVRTVTQRLRSLFRMHKLKARRILSFSARCTGEQSTLLPSCVAYRQFWRRAISPSTDTQKYKHTSSILIPIPAVHSKLLLFCLFIPSQQKSTLWKKVLQVLSEI